MAERAVAPYRDAGEQRSLAPAQKSAATEQRVENVPDPAQKPIRGNVAFGVISAILTVVRLLSR